MFKKTFLGVYSAQSKDVRGQPQKALYFAWHKGNVYEVQRLDGAFTAVGVAREMQEAAFKTLFTHQPSILAVPLKEKTSATPEPPPQPSAEEVESTLRAHFRKALLRLKHATDKKAALTALQTLVEVEEGIETRHKHMFTEFGVQMRKHKEYKTALAFCKRVLELAPGDDHAHFNASRILLEMGQWDDAEKYLHTAIHIAPDIDMYQKMLRHLHHERHKRQRPLPTQQKRRPIA